MTNNTTQLKRDYFWNTAASLTSSLALVIMLTAVTRSTDIAIAGSFSLAISIGQQFQALGMYEVRTFHVTDVENEYRFGTYLSTRIITSIAMIIGIVIYCGLSSRDIGTFWTLTLVALLRLYDTFEDVFYSEFQRSNHLDIGARGSFIRICSTIISFSLGIFLTTSLIWAAIIAIIISTAAFLAVFIPYSRSIFSLRPQWQKSSIIRLLKQCLPLFLASFISIYLVNAPRFAIDHYLDNTSQGYFAIIYMPAVAINMLSLLVFRPLLTPLATKWAEGDKKAFNALINKGLFATLGAFIAVSLVAVTIGVPILNVVFRNDISHLRLELLVLIGAGCLNAASVILYYALTTMRKQNKVFICYICAALTVFIACLILVPTMALLGAAWAYTAAMAVLCLAFTISLKTKN